MLASVSHENVVSYKESFIDVGAFNQTTIHTLEIIDGAFVVLAAPGLEPGSLSDAKVASVTSVNRLEGDGTGRLRIVDDSTMIIKMIIST